MRGLTSKRLISVRHRIDGLEKWQSVIALATLVRHRIDGLEILCDNSL